MQWNKFENLLFNDRVQIVGPSSRVFFSFAFIQRH